MHDLRHTAASVWLAAGADPKVVQRVLGHPSAAMTIDPYGHLVDDNLWAAAKRVSEGTSEGDTDAGETRLGRGIRGSTCDGVWSR